MVQGPGGEYFVGARSGLGQPHDVIRLPGPAIVRRGSGRGIEPKSVYRDRDEIDCIGGRSMLYETESTIDELGRESTEVCFFDSLKTRHPYPNLCFDAKHPR
jgi:hypothetical protein